MTDTALAGGDAAAKREAAAWKVKHATNVTLPKLQYWNYGPCKHHETPQPDCAYRECGGDLFDHQRVGVMWLYLRKRGLLADLPGAGKTAQVTALLCLLKERKELTKRAILVINTPAVMQWYEEMQRFAPGLQVEVIAPGLTKKKRLERYSNSWDVLLVGQHMMNKDIDLLTQLTPEMTVSDDVDALLNHTNKAHKNFLKLCETADRVVVINASSTQNKITQLHASMMPITGFSLWGSLPMFESRYVKMEWDNYYTTENGMKKKHAVSRAVGIQNGQELKDRLAPWVLRRTYADLNDIHMPDLMPPTNVWLDLYPRQRAKYEELREGVITIQHASGSTIQKHARALAAFTYGSQLCGGLPALGEADGVGQSVKLDWLMHRLTEVWTGDEKLVVFCPYRKLVEALQARLHNVGIGSAVVWGDQSQAERTEERARFWRDPKCRVMIGTTAIERSLNLQNANIVVNLGMILNPERMRQILGRVRRAGSAHDKVWQFNLLCVNTQEAGYLQVLSEREAVNGFVWGESDGIFPKLSPEQMLALIRP